MGRDTILAGLLAGVLATGSITGPALADSKPTILMLAGALFDPFFTAMKNGADAAAQATGSNYQYITISNNNDIMGDYVRLVQQAIARKPDAIVVGNFFPGPLDPILKQASANGIPVVVVDGGEASWRDDGAVAYVGYNAEALGKAAGEVQAKAGVKHALCVNHVPGNPSLESICNGYAEAIKTAGGDSQVLMIQTADANNATTVAQAIEGTLKSHPEIDGMMTLGAAVGIYSIKALDDTGKTGKVFNGSLGLSTAVLQAVKDGKLSYVADLQPYLDGYQAILSAYNYVEYGFRPVGEVTTGPNFITKDNVDATIAVNRKHPGIRGAL